MCRPNPVATRGPGRGALDQAGAGGDGQRVAVEDHRLAHRGQHLLGGAHQRLRALRLEQQETLSETAGRAGVSPQYLSEVERGRKEPSSEMIAALAGALGVTLTGLTEQVAGDLRRQQDAITSRAVGRAAGPVMLALAA